MAVPAFLLRKLYKRGSLRELPGARFTFSLHNPLGMATLVSPPHIVVNGVAHPPNKIRAGAADLASITPVTPFLFPKGDEVELELKGHLLRGGNRIHVVVQTREWGELDMLFDVPGAPPMPSSEEE